MTPRELREIARAGLLREPKSLPPVLFYDEVGSTLFEKITELPEYYLTRTERALLGAHADEIVDMCMLHGSPFHIAELGAGSADKSALLVVAAARRARDTTFWPMDVSQEALRLAGDNAQIRASGARVRPILGAHAEGLLRAASIEGRKLLLFIGSSIGNYADADAVLLLRRVRAALGPGDAFLLGADKTKDIDVLLRAYDDSAGVTAAFNKNVLARLNRELGADFDLARFRHVAQWNARESCVSMFLESTEAQRVHVGALGVEIAFARGERLHTENSVKYDDARLFGMLREAGLTVRRSFADARDWFGLHLCAAE